MRKLFVLPPLAVFSVSLINLALGNYFYFSLWLIATILVSLMALPIAFNTNDKDVPVFHVFSFVLIIPIFFSVYAILDLQRIGFFNQAEIFLYGILLGFGFLILIMVLKGK
ncbi:MAG: hypothetical protein U5L10_02590 [Candidatus Moranbacteria bacterium]|nr:hypothetical protein [Candidatus Moranbacteria bacterium]